MSILQKSNKKVSARSQIDLKGAKDSILMLPNHRYRAVLNVSSINFELKSEDEQDAIIDTYESFLNSVGYALQVVVRTREIDMDKYLEELDSRTEGEVETIYRNQLKNYGEFIRGLISDNRILTREFYVVVPYDTSSHVDFETVKEQLGLRVDIVIKGLARLGIHSRQLTSLEALELFYSFYNPTQAKLQPLTAQALEVIHTTLIRKENP